ncbi:extended synaptotagmin-3 [Trichonephila clavipes]|nr:extended synaptotagmin-3 [Trichonephila clavipes]
MSRFGGLSEERPSVFKTRSKLGTHLSTQCSGDERQSRPCAAPKIIELIPGRDGEIRTVWLKTQHGTVIRPVQRICPLEVQAIANSDKELKEESISVKSTKPEKVLNTNDAIVKKKYTSSGRFVKEPKRLDLLNYNCYSMTTTKYNILNKDSTKENNTSDDKLVSEIDAANSISKTVKETVESARSVLRFNVYAIAGGFISLTYGAYLVGHSGFGATSMLCIGLGVAVSAWMMRNNYLTERDIGLSIDRSVSLNEKDCILARLTDLPSWVFFPETERVEWVNKILKQLWPYVGVYVKEMLKETMEPSIRESLPSYLQSFRFEKIILGDMGLGSNPSEDMDICKCMVPLRHGGTLNSRRAASPLMRLVAGDERVGWQYTRIYNPQRHPRVLVIKCGTDPSQIVLSPAWCSMLQPMTGVHLAYCHDEFRGPRSDYIRQVALATT